jgi:type III secretory pathway component EscS
MYITVYNNVHLECTLPYYTIYIMMYIIMYITNIQQSILTIDIKMYITMYVLNVHYHFLECTLHYSNT